MNPRREALIDLGIGLAMAFLLMALGALLAIAAPDFFRWVSA